MSPRHRVSRAAIELIKRFEGYRRQAAQLPDGRWTIGHGHTLTAREGAQVSADDAEALLLYDLIQVSHALNEAVFAPLNQNQFDALASFVFNIGGDNFRQSGVLKRLNEGDAIRAACAMELWRKANVAGERIVIDALVRRRAAEKALFLTPPNGDWVPAPTPLLPPLVDSDAREIVPLQAPVAVTAELDGDRLVLAREAAPTPVPVAPEPEEEAEPPVRAAAEAVTQRLSTLFQEPGPEPEVEVEGEPERVPETPHPQADVAPPQPVGEDPVPFFLRAQDPETEPDVPSADGARDAPKPAWAETEDGPETADLFGPGSGPDALDDADPGDAGLADAAEDDRPGEAEAGYGEDRLTRSRLLIDDQAPFEYEPPVSRPLPERPEGGLLTLVALAALGLVFFGGGIFWATYAHSAAGMFGPRLVGGLAGIAGVGFFVVAVYLLLDRLGRAAERAARERD